MGCRDSSAHNSSTYLMPGAPNRRRNSFKRGNPPSLISSRNTSLTRSRAFLETMAVGLRRRTLAMSRFRSLLSVPRTYLNSFMRETKCLSLRLRQSSSMPHRSHRSSKASASSGIFSSYPSSSSFCCSSMLETWTMISAVEFSTPRKGCVAAAMPLFRPLTASFIRAPRSFLSPFFRILGSPGGSSRTSPSFPPPRSVQTMEEKSPNTSSRSSVGSSLSSVGLRRSTSVLIPISFMRRARSASVASETRPIR
mmetsp:Transcript_20710/g.59376  ORF Transcript_20710/g.59376 Transcript_20710/m.59376 type:complete len:252 (+) Transcript_20710:1609-2364(+)